MRLYFFPALLPLASALPLVLAGLGALAGVLRALRRRRLWGWLSLALVAAAGALAWSKRPPPLGELPRIIPIPVTDSASPTISPPQAASKGTVPLSDAWYQMTPRHSFSGLTLTPGGLLLIGTLERAVDAYDARNGRLLWTLPQTEPLLGEVAVRGSLAWSGGGLHQTVRSRLTQFDLDRRKVLWQREFPGHIEMPARPSNDGATVYLASGPSGIWALDIRDGSTRWHAAIGHADGTPLVSGEWIYATAQPDETKTESRLYALRATDGSVVSSLTLTGLPWGAPTQMGPRIAFTTGIGQVNEVRKTDRGWLHAYDPTLAKLVWSIELPGMALLTPIYLESEDLLIVTIKTGELIAFGASDGAIAWRLKLGGPTMASAHRLAPPHQNWLAAVTTSGQLTLVDARSGKTLHQETVGPNSTSAPASSADQLYVATPEGIAAFHLGSVR